MYAPQLSEPLRSRAPNARTESESLVLSKDIVETTELDCLGHTYEEDERDVFLAPHLTAVRRPPCPVLTNSCKLSCLRVATNNSVLTMRDRMTSTTSSPAPSSPAKAACARNSAPLGTGTLARCTPATTSTPTLSTPTTTTRAL